MSRGDYIKENKVLILLGTFLAVFPGMIMMLSTEGSWIESDGVYCIMVTAVVWSVFLFWDYRKKKRYFRQLTAFRQDKDLDFVLSVPRGHTAEEGLYRELLLQEKTNADKIMEAAEDKKTEDMEFIETWVHEAKTPIAAIRLIIENSLDHPTEQSLYDISDELLQIEDAVQKTICYSELNDFSKDCQIENVNLMKVVNYCIKREYSNIRNKHLKIEIGDTDFEVNSDTKWLSFIVKQILDNAVKYSSEGGTIHILAMNELHNRRLIIADEGIGIREEDLRQITSRGYTGKNGRTSVHATGIGLYLSHKLAAKLGHEIRIESKVKEGTTVTILFEKGAEEAAD